MTILDSQLDTIHGEGKDFRQLESENIDSLTDDIKK